MPLPPSADEPAKREDAEPTLPTHVINHLGRLLASVYSPDFFESDTTARFADLLADIHAALNEANDNSDAEFRRMLVAAIPALRRFAISLIRRSTAADDLVQETLLRAWKNRALFKLGTNFEAWTFTIMRNQFYSDHRRHREVQDSDGVHASRLTTLPDQAGRLDLQDLETALARLNPLMREALMLVTVEGLSYEDAASVMDCQLGTVKSRVSRGREQLMSLLGYTGGEIGNDAMMLSAKFGPKRTGV